MTSDASGFLWSATQWRVKRYPFEAVKDGDIWAIQRADQAESIQNSFNERSDRLGLSIRASRKRDKDGTTTIRFSTGFKKLPKGKKHKW